MMVLVELGDDDGSGRHVYKLVSITLIMPQSKQVLSRGQWINTLGDLSATSRFCQVDQIPDIWQVRHCQSTDCAHE
jgi:hypothetical protein